MDLEMVGYPVPEGVNFCQLDDVHSLPALPRLKSSNYSIPSMMRLTHVSEKLVRSSKQGWKTDEYTSSRLSSITPKLVVSDAEAPRCSGPTFRGKMC